jgi:hypothetical protein
MPTLTKVKMRAAKWEQREKDFQTMEEALLVIKKHDWNVSIPQR